MNVYKIDGAGLDSLFVMAADADCALSRAREINRSYCSTQVTNHDSEILSVYRYYLPMRPPSIGTHPKGEIKIEAFDTKTIVPSIGRSAWGYVEYAEPLTQKQIDDYELMEA